MTSSTILPLPPRCDRRAPPASAASAARGLRLHPVGIQLEARIVLAARARPRTAARAAAGDRRRQECARSCRTAERHPRTRAAASPSSASSRGGWSPPVCSVLSTPTNAAGIDLVRRDRNADAVRELDHALLLQVGQPHVALDQVVLQHLRALQLHLELRDARDGDAHLVVHALPFHQVAGAVDARARPDAGFVRFAILDRFVRRVARAAHGRDAEREPRAALRLRRSPSADANGTRSAPASPSGSTRRRPARRRGSPSACGDRRW